MRLKPIVLVLCICGALLGLASASAAAAQRIDLKVLLLGATGSEPSFQAWQAQLRREGVPYDQIVARPEHRTITEATLSTTREGISEAKYQAIIVATGNLIYCETTCRSALSTEEWATIVSYERTFHVRQISAYVYPAPEFGLNWPTYAGAVEGLEWSLTTAGRTAFPYLNGTVTVASGTYGYKARPLETTFTSYLSDAEGNALLGVYRHEDGREELVQTFDGNANQLHTQLLRHGELAWVTRGTYLGDQRNYLEMQVDDVFLPDDIWNTSTHTTDYRPEDAVRMSAEDARRAVSWSSEKRLRLDMVFNGGGSTEYAEEHGGSDPLLTELRANASSFGWVNHTWDHPNLDCSTREFISGEITRNVSWAREKGFTVSGAELVTGEHSGLANLRPGNPGTIDPPFLDSASVSSTGGTLAAGRYEWGVTATDEGGQTTASITTLSASGSTSSATFRWEAICKATSYKVYRRSSPEGTWALLTTISQPSPAFNEAGPVTISYTDRGGAGSAGSPPSSNGATLSPYGQNANFVGALEETSVTDVAADASKPYPVTPTSTEGPTYPAGTSFVDGPARTVPRYPTNVYYNVATRAQLLDEYNHLYLPPELGGVCVPSEVTTCRSSAARWEEFLELESQLIFTHMMGNDPRPHYFHQTNLAESERAEGAVLYPVVEATLGLYSRYFSTSSAPIQQLTPTQIATLLGRQGEWASSGGSTITGYIEGREVKVTNSGLREAPVPVTGTEFGTSYGGTRSGWDEDPAGTTTYTAATEWPRP